MKTEIIGGIIFILLLVIVIMLLRPENVVYEVTVIQYNDSVYDTVMTYFEENNASGVHYRLGNKSQFFIIKTYHTNVSLVYEHEFCHAFVTENHEHFCGVEE